MRTRNPGLLALLTSTGALVASGCVAVRPAPVSSPVIVTRAANAPGHLPVTCAVLRPDESAAHGGMLSVRLVMQLHDESAAHVTSAVCSCARGHGVYAPGVVRVRTTLVPGRGTIGGAVPATEGGVRDSDDWPAFGACLERTLASATMPVHVIGSCMVPDPDPTDERVVMHIRVELR